MKTVKLQSGFDMPVIGLGTWKSKPGEVAKAVSTALELGYRHIDCAYVYKNEAEVGEGLKDCLDRELVTRGEIFVTSKLWINKMHPDDVRAACEKSLADLGCNYLDLYLMHWPIAIKFAEDTSLAEDDRGNFLYSDVHYTETWKAMEGLVDSGLVRSIGVSNFNRRQVQRLWDSARVKPSVLQIEIHPHCKNLKLAEFAKGLGLQVTAYCPLGSPGVWPSTKENPGVMNDPVVTKIAARSCRSPAQVLIRYGLDRGLVVIPKSVTAARIKENRQVFDFQLTEEDLAELNAIPTHSRICANSVVAGPHPEYPFNDEF